MLGKELVDFVVRNYLMDVKIRTEWTDGLSWNIFLDDEEKLELEYNWNYNGKHTIYYFDWTNYDANDPESFPKKQEISEAAAFTLRKRFRKID